LKQTAWNAGTPDGPSVQVYEYPSGSFPAAGNRERSAKPHPSILFGTRTNQAEAIGKPSQETRDASADLRAEFDRRLAEETHRSFETGREQGRLEGRHAECEAHAGTVVATERERLRKATELVDNFARERDRHFAEVEREVVALALGIAARILRREAQMDPLLLTGAVRVALGQLSASTAAQLVVPLAELDLWKETIAHTPNLAIKPTVVAGEGMRMGECMIKTDLGSVDLGLRSQLAEIERGFFDRVGSTRTAADVAAREAGR
jgi:flagellar assembly protein FliH